MTTFRVELTTSPGLKRALAALRQPALREVFRRALLRSAFKVQEISTRQKIRAGGVVGTGKSRMNLPPLPDRLTSRTGTLRRSIAVDRSALPFEVSIGSDLVYAAVHETGGLVHRRSGTARYPARPFLGPALEDASAYFDDYLERELRAEAGV